MLGSSLIGRELDWHPVGDPPGTWAYLLDGEAVAELWWSPEDREVKAEVGTTLWKMPIRGVFLLRGAVIDSDLGVSKLHFAGGLRRGLAGVPRGPRFTLFTRLDRELGPWVGINDDQGDGVLRVQGRIGGGAIWSAVKVTPDRRHAAFIVPLLLLWGGLSVLRRTIPWLSITTALVSDAPARRELERLLEPSSR